MFVLKFNNVETVEIRRTGDRLAQVELRYLLTTDESALTARESLAGVLSHRRHSVLNRHVLCANRLVTLWPFVVQPTMSRNWRWWLVARDLYQSLVHGRPEAHGLSACLLILCSPSSSLFCTVQQCIFSEKTLIRLTISLSTGSIVVLLAMLNE